VRRKLFKATGHCLNHFLRIIRRYSPGASATGVVTIFVRDHPLYR
jgi:hypothetical protein